MLGKEVTDYKEAINEIVNMGVKTVIVTLGSKGSVYNDGEIIKTRDVVKSKVVDTTAAGDTYTGYFLAGIMEGMSLQQSMERANIAAAAAVTRAGAAESIPRKEQLPVP